MNETAGSKSQILVQGIFVADLAFWSDALPQKGETLIGNHFHINPGGKGSNQAIAARRAGGDVHLLAKLGNDTFGTMARDFYRDEGLNSDLLFESTTTPTGAAAINILASTGENSIVVVPGAGAELTTDELKKIEPLLKDCSVFLTQLETPLELSFLGLQMAHAAGVTTILNPAPAADFPVENYRHIDIVTPNEVEAAQLCGREVNNEKDAQWAADFFLDHGVKTAIITLGAAGALVKTKELCELVPAFELGQVVDTSGAGDAFNGGLAVALSEGMDILSAARFANATASLSVTKPGTAKSAPSRQEIEQVLRF